MIVVSDALDFLRDLPDDSVPLFLFSPPYNLGNSSGGGLQAYRGHYSDAAGFGKRGGKGRWKNAALASGYGDFDDTMPHDEYVAWQHALLSECWRCLPDTGAIFYNHKPRIFHGVLVEPRDYVPAGLTVRQRIIWARAGGINCSPTFYCSTYEELLVICKPDFRLTSKGASAIGDVWYIPQESNTWHPAPFPLPLAQRVLETTMPTLVCDPFAGSGTVAKAARQFGIDFIGCDRNPRYVERANKELERVQRVTLRQTRMLVDVDQASLLEAV